MHYKRPRDRCQIWGSADPRSFNALEGATGRAKSRGTRSFVLVIGLTGVRERTLGGQETPEERLKAETVRELSRRLPGNSKPGQLLLPKLIEQSLDGEVQLLRGLVGPRLDRPANLLNALFADFGVTAEVV